MTLDPLMFTQQALAGKAQLIPDPANTFISQVATILGSTPTAAVSPAVTSPTGLYAFRIAVPNVASTQTYTYLTNDAIEIVDVTVLKSGAGAANTITVQASAGNTITDAIAAAVDLALTRAAQCNTANRTIAAGGQFQVLSTYAAGSSLCEVNVICRRL